MRAITNFVLDMDSVYWTMNAVEVNWNTSGLPPLKLLFPLFCDF